MLFRSGTKGFVDHLPESVLRRYEHDLYRFIANSHPDIFRDILARRELDDDLRGRIDAALKEFNEVFSA